MLSMVISILTSFYFGFLIDRIIPNKLEFTLLFIVLLMIGGTLLKVLIDWIRAKDVLKVSRNINLKLHLLYYKHILKLPMGILDLRKSGELLSRFQDVDKIQEALISSILVLPANLVLVFVVGGLLAYKNYVLFLIVLTMCLCYSLTIIGFSNCYMSLNALEMNDQARVMAHLVDSVEGIQTIKSYNYGEKIYTIGLQKISDWQNRLFRLGESENCQEAIKAIINMLGEILILSIGVYEIMNGELSIGELVTYNVLVSYLLNPIKNMIGLQSIFHTAQIAMERLENVLDIEIEKENGLEIKKSTSLELKNICFGFNSHLDVLKNINLKIDMGNKIAIVGKTGSGKTSLAKLLMRFYYPDKGNIVYGNLDYKEYGVKSIRDCIIYVSQEDFIFSSSIRENLKLGDQNISDSEMISISRELGVDEFVARMPRGYDSVLDERGANLSKGQRQRIALARAILKKPKVLILDEATSNMDYGSEKKIIRFLKSQKYLTVITITHGMSSIIDSDYIYVMNSGSIVSCGVYDELLKTSLQFQELLYEEET
ncbi:peptidase domain-containing ABC transporter [Lachnospiraceae bacterium MD308]|nr:peptidase domain-containing ABC transporter [Lachnospiraceae bacterium MD308]